MVNHGVGVEALPLEHLGYWKVISMYVSVLHQTSGSRATQYFRLMVCRACACSSGGRMRAAAVTWGPVTFPRMVHGATITWALLRMRFVFPISLRVIT